MNVNDRIIRSDRWELNVPSSINSASRLVVIPTIHPRGDQRVLRCAQVALDRGYRVHFIWEGAGDPTCDVAVSEEFIRPSGSFLHRLTNLPRLMNRALRYDSKFWHIHDYYMLPFALLAYKLKGIKSIYDVHEYYPEYYSSKLPRPMQKISRGLISWCQTTIAKSVGGANVVAQEMSVDFVRKGVPTSVTPNLPLFGPFKDVVEPPVDERSGVIHTGSLSDAYGMTLILDIARHLRSMQSDVSIDVIRRFTTRESELKFFSMLAEYELSDTVRIIEPVAPHEIALLLSRYHVGISTILGQGQNELAVPTKLYEYVLANLFVIGTERSAQRRFLENWGLFKLFSDNDTLGMAKTIIEICETSDILDRGLSLETREYNLSWDRGPAKLLGDLMTTVFVK